MESLKQTLDLYWPQRRARTVVSFSMPSASPVITYEDGTWDMELEMPKLVAPPAQEVQIENTELRP